MGRLTAAVLGERGVNERRSRATQWQHHCQGGWWSWPCREVSWRQAGTLGRAGVSAQNQHQAQAEWICEPPSVVPVSPLGKLVKWPGVGGPRKDEVLILPQAGGRHGICSVHPASWVREWVLAGQTLLWAWEWWPNAWGEEGLLLGARLKPRALPGLQAPWTTDANVLA